MSIEKFTPIVLNLGCGQTRIPGSIGVDRIPIKGFVDVVHDLNIVPYPFESNYADEIHFYHVLEHLDDPIKKMEEIHRILKPNGILNMRVPHFSSHGAFTDITHKRPFSYYSFDCFFGESYHDWYTTAKFILVQRKIKYFGQYPNQGIYAQYIHPNKCFWLVKPLVQTINAMITISPMFFERIWCYWVGGACEVSFVLQKYSG